MENDDKKFPRKKDFISKSFQPTKKAINNSDFEEQEEINEEELEVEDKKIRNTKSESLIDFRV